MITNAKFKTDLTAVIFDNNIASDIGVPADILAEQLITHLEGLNYAISVRDDFIGLTVPKSVSDPVPGSVEDEVAKLRLEVKKLQLSIGQEVKRPSPVIEGKLELRDIAPGYINIHKENNK